MIQKHARFLVSSPLTYYIKEHDGLVVVWIKFKVAKIWSTQHLAPNLKLNVRIVHRHHC